MQETSKDFPECFYRVSIKGLCVRNGNFLLAEGLHANNKLSWDIPGGGLDFGEDIRVGFEREVEEEMGLKVSYMSDRPFYVWTHKFKNCRDLEWFHSIFLLYRVDFEDLNITPTDECLRVKFFSKDDLKTLDLGKNVRSLYERFNPSDFPDL